MACDDQLAANVTEIEAKRSDEAVSVSVDWHDFLANLRKVGAAVASGVIIRLSRARATGLQYRCTTAGTTSGQPTERLRWPSTAGQTLTDGSVVWTAEAMSDASLRTTISANNWPAVTGLTFGTTSNADLIYTLLVSGGMSGQTYDIEHEITCVNSEVAAQILRMAVQD